MLIVLSVSHCLVINFDVLNKQRITIWELATNAFTTDIEKQVDKFSNILFMQLHQQYKKLMYILFSIHKSYHKGIEIKCYFSFCHMKRNIKCNPLFSAVAFVLEFKYESVDPNLIICKKITHSKLNIPLTSSYSKCRAMNI